MTAPRSSWLSARVSGRVGKTSAHCASLRCGQGITPAMRALAPIAAMKKLNGELNGFNRDDIGPSWR